MTEASQKRAGANYRRRLAECGFVRYEVCGLERDKELIRRFAKRLAADDVTAMRLREEVAREVSPQPLSGKKIWAALRRSPLVGIDLDIEREFTTDRDVDP
jgi:hypothetical protein